MLPQPKKKEPPKTPARDQADARLAEIDSALEASMMQSNSGSGE
jgi:hypothetical protein